MIMAESTPWSTVTMRRLNFKWTEEAMDVCIVSGVSEDFSPIELHTSSTSIVTCDDDGLELEPEPVDFGEWAAHGSGARRYSNFSLCAKR